MGGLPSITGGVIGSLSDELELSTNQLLLTDLIERERSESFGLGVEIIYPDKQPLRDAVEPMKT